MQVIRRTLPHSSDFKRFWKDSGPFEFALTSAEYPPVLLAPEEWIFGHTARDVLEALMGFSPGKAKIVRSEFNPQNTRILRPDKLIPWKIQSFPKNGIICRVIFHSGRASDPGGGGLGDSRPVFRR